MSVGERIGEKRRGKAGIFGREEERMIGERREQVRRVYRGVKRIEEEMRREEVKR